MAHDNNFASQTDEQRAKQTGDDTDRGREAGRTGQQGAQNQVDDNEQGQPGQRKQNQQGQLGNQGNGAGRSSQGQKGAEGAPDEDAEGASDDVGREDPSTMKTPHGQQQQDRAERDDR